MNKYPKLRYKGFNENFKKLNLISICHPKKGKQINKDTLKNEGFPVLNGGLTYSGYTGKYNVVAPAICISEGGESCGYVTHMKENFWAGGHLYYLSSIKDEYNLEFIYFNLKKNEKSIMSKRVGSTLPNIQKGDIDKIDINFPKLEEQQKISNLLSKMDILINEKDKEIELLKIQKQFNLQKLLTKTGVPLLRFSGFYDQLRYYKLSDYIDYVQPTKFLVKEVSQEGIVPILTPNKSFVIGATNDVENSYKAKDNPVIIFDDFTTDYKYVNFDFMMKSSATKILKSNKIDIKAFEYIFEKINYIPESHRRHWIEIFSNIEVLLPNKEELIKITKLLSSMDNLITKKQNELAKQKEIKKYLLNKLLV